ncbi:hypothetical protein GQ42DRAFT_113769, partial [Ramicandelaber brevisporus]
RYSIKDSNPALWQQLHSFAGLIQNEKFLGFALINLGLFLVALGAFAITRFVYGPLRRIEIQNTYDRLLNYVLFKLVFVGAIMKPHWEELFIWVAWYALAGAARILVMIARDRLDHAVLSADTQVEPQHVRAAIFLGIVGVATLEATFLCKSIAPDMFWMLAFESATLFIETVHAGVKYGVALIEASGWQPLSYLTDFFAAEVSVLLLTLIHYFHIAYLHRFSLSVVDVILGLNVRSVLLNLMKRISAMLRHRSVAFSLDMRFPDASKSQLADHNDDCAICRDTMFQAKVLPCGHLFHAGCIASWLDQHSSCPVCRISL